MPSFSTDFIQTVVSSDQRIAAPTKQYPLVPSHSLVYFSLEILDEPSESILSDWNLFANQEEIRTIKHGRSYQVRISSSPDRDTRPHFIQQRLNIHSSIELQLVCTEASVIIDNPQYAVPLEAVSSYEQIVKITVFQECPTRVVRFGLLCHESGIKRLVASLDATLEGTYNLADADFMKETKVELDTSLPEQTAIVHIMTSSTDKLSMRGWSRRSEKLQVNLQGWEPIKLGEFIERGISPENVIHAVRRFSRNKVGELIAWLKKLLNKYEKQLCLVIADHTDMETPWEMLELGDEEYLGALAMVVRWTYIRYFADCHTLKVHDAQKQGSVLAYLDDEELGARQTYREREALRRLKRKDCRDLKELKQHLRRLEPDHNVGLIYLGCHGYEGRAIGSLHSPSERITQLDLEIPKVYPDPRPIVFVNACESARLKRDGKDYFSGLLEVLLARFASGYIGTLGRVGSAYASTVAECVLQHACTPEGVQVAEVLRQLRAEAVRESLEDELAGLSDEERQRREERFLYAFMYVYYGNALVRLRLIDAEETEVDA